MSSLAARKNPTEDDTNPERLHCVAYQLLLLLFNSGGFGVLTAQTYFYLLAFQKEWWGRRFIVYSIYILELAQTVLITRTMFRSFVYGFLDKSSLNNIYDLWFSVPIIGGSVACIVQTFYAYRIAVLAKCLDSTAVMAVVVFVLIVSLAQLTGGIMLGVEMARLKLFSEIIETRTRISSMLWLGGEVLCDICIAICMFHLLRRSKVEGSTRIHSQRIIRLTIETGAMTATVALLNIFLIQNHGSRLYYQPSAAAISKLYSNTLLLSLNSRTQLTSEGLRSEFYSTHMSFSSDHEGSSTIASQARKSCPVGDTINHRNDVVIHRRPVDVSQEGRTHLEGQYL